ncbi:2-amino-4-hydroxy-6-hydroxymethyldihydropteridine diphosphokinase [Labrenzia sp. EL_159]|nr:2-amino-4-hydroxy-6-hydroxymethyldihydropteridine diphosphokinase [Labrenzia sp. EL_142]MBG6157328.1 2-amino-4-hydroxy-6-hydroxymethyldihydropteridine diphosphokinase [Labrenzia sp. EL_162]MBG6196278.1 2-amino-4-hydroxy-6-hydroxymethyldihydropteridine diphosphokinase [Labrenzia sp. EL_159]
MNSSSHATDAPFRSALGLGSNLGDPIGNLDDAVRRLSETDGITLVARSSNYRTPPWGPVPQDDFVNICVVIDTILNPQQLLKRCLEVENELGRVREVRWGPRVIDVDVLLYGSRNIHEDNLEVPHPRMGERAFVLVPLAEIWPDALLIDGRTAAEALETCPGQDGVIRMREAN